MAHFAKINSNNIVEEVLGISNCAIGSCIGKDHWDYQEEYHKNHKGKTDFPESEALGQAVLAESGFEGTWIQTSYNGKFRVRFAGVGMIYDKDKDEFVVPQTESTDSTASS
jgi:hypothetical protein